jgi:hypothetical protein
MKTHSLVLKYQQLLTLVFFTAWVNIAIGQLPCIRKWDKLDRIRNGRKELKVIQEGTKGMNQMGYIVCIYGNVSKKPLVQSLYTNNNVLKQV